MTHIETFRLADRSLSHADSRLSHAIEVRGRTQVLPDIVTKVAVLFLNLEFLRHLEVPSGMIFFRRIPAPEAPSSQIIQT